MGVNEKNNLKSSLQKHYEVIVLPSPKSSEECSLPETGPGERGPGAPAFSTGGPSEQGCRESKGKSESRAGCTRQPGGHWC